MVLILCYDVLQNIIKGVITMFFNKLPELKYLLKNTSEKKRIDLAKIKVTFKKFIEPLNTGNVWGVLFWDLS